MPGQAWKRVVFATAVLTFLGASAGVAFGLAQPADNGRPVAEQGQDPGSSPAVDANADGGTSVPQNSVTTAPSPPANDNNGGGNTDGNNNTGTTKVSVPGLNGLSESDARTHLKNKGLGVTVKYSCDGNSDPGKVSYQQPYADSSVDKGTKVNLTVEGVKVLDVVGQYQGDAKGKLEELKFKVVVNDPESGDAGGSVSRQSPSGGSCVKYGSTVTLWVASQSSPAAEGSPEPPGTGG
jgi:hypothetical protein